MKKFDMEVDIIEHRRAELSVIAENEDAAREALYDCSQDIAYDADWWLVDRRVEPFRWMGEDEAADISFNGEYDIRQNGTSIIH